MLKSDTYYKRLVFDRWKEPKKFILELLIVNFVGLALSLGLDLIHWLIEAGMGLTHTHPFEFGILQILGTLFFGTMLARAVSYSRYYF